MLRNYFKVAIRSHRRSKAFSFINLFGLTTGMLVCLIVAAFVRYEKGFDRQYPENVYRICERQEQNDIVTRVAQTRFPLAPVMKTEIPGIRDFTRIISWEKVPMTTALHSNITATTLGADASFFRLFDVQLLRGNAANALKEPGSLVLTKTTAQRLFGNINPIGQLVHFERRDTMLFHVTGIMADVPERSHLQYEAVYSLSTEERPGWMKDWSNSWAFTYVKLEQHIKTGTLESGFPSFIQKHIALPGTVKLGLFLQPVRDIHLYSADITHDLLNTRKFNGSYMLLLEAVALFVIVLGIINYINLSTARLLTRAREVGIRKTNGAGWKEIIFQFLLETVLLSLIASIVAIALLPVLFPLVEQLLQRQFTLPILKDPMLVVIAAGMAIATGLSAGLLPAVTMSRIKPASVLKGRLWTSYRSPLRSALVVIQFAIAISLSMATFIVHRQLKFLQQYDTGFNKDAVIVIPVNYADRQKEESLMQQLKQIPGVGDVTGALRRMGSSIDINEVVFKGNRQEQSFRCATMFTDFNYIPFYGIELLAGRNLSPEFSADRNGQSYIINETMARQLMPYSAAPNTSFSALIGRPFRYGFEDSMGSIIAVARNFNFNSLHEGIQPLCLTYLHDYFFTDISVRLHTGNASDVMARAEKKWKEIFPGKAFSWHYLDVSLQELYRSDIQTGTFMKIFTVIAFCISCLGLIGVATFTIERRAKEIGVRKVLGAEIRDIVLLLTGGFIKLIFISICIALPAAWWWMYSWLAGYAYHVRIHWWMFALMGFIALLIGILTVGIQSAKAALANPVESIKQE